MSWSLRQTRRGSNRDFGGSFHGMVVRQTYTKAAHLTCLKEMLPKGKITLVGEQESQTTRVAPHIFRNLIKEDLFEWFVIAFDKKASEPRTAKRIADSNSRLKAYKANFPAKLQADMSDYEIMEMYCAEYLKTEFTEDRFRNRSPYANKTFESLQFPQVWIRSPGGGSYRVKVGMTCRRKLLYAVYLGAHTAAAVRPVGSRRSGKSPFDQGRAPQTVKSL